MASGDTALEWRGVTVDQHTADPASSGSSNQTVSLSFSGGAAYVGSFGLNDATFKLSGSGQGGYNLPLDPTKTYKILVVEQ